MLRSAPPRPVALAALVLGLGLTLGADPALAAKVDAEAGAGEKAGATAIGECALRYHASLELIAQSRLPAMKDAFAQKAGASPASAATIESDPLLPGVLLFNAPARPRSPAEISALTAAVALARSKGRSTSATGSDDAGWIAARLREDLGDYLSQKPTPYLCNGVPAYLKTLRAFAARLGPLQDRRSEWIATQKAAAERSVGAALAAIHAGRAAQAKPPEDAALRPGTTLARNETTPTAPPPGVPLDSTLDLAAAVDSLMSEVRAAGFAKEPQAAGPEITNGIATPAPAGAPSATPPAPPIMNPALSKLAAAKPAVMSARPWIQDRTVRLKVLAAFADLEALSYLTGAKAQAADPVAASIGDTLKAIEDAQRTDCTCAAVVPPVR